MKISALLLVLLAAAWTGSQGMSLRSSKSQCCSEKMLTRKKIPEFMIQGYQETDPTCTLRAFLVELPQVRVCVDPKQKWFQKYLRKQEKQEKQEKQKQPNSTST
ncbi:CCL18 protein, partial [Toxostoma redivivum]|nr:CCL18 protein [Toxostoma redivivum]